MKHKHQEFPSDVFISFESANALITLVGPDKQTPPTQVNLVDFLGLDLKGKFIYSVTFKQLNFNTKSYFRTFKIMPRYRNAHAYVNAGFNFNINTVTFRVETVPTIVYGGISSDFVHAKQTEFYLFGKQVNDEKVLLNAFKILSQEVNPEYRPELSSVQYRKSLAISLFYKFLLYVNDLTLGPKYKSGQNSVMDMRPDVTTSKQVYPTPNKDMYPVTEPMTKLNSYLQTSGEAKYVYDMPPFANQLYGVFIQSKIGACKLDQIDSAEASKMPGVARILFASDIPGQNNYFGHIFGKFPEELFATSSIYYAGQGIGLVLAGFNFFFNTSVKFLFTMC